MPVQQPSQPGYPHSSFQNGNYPGPSGGNYPRRQTHYDSYPRHSYNNWGHDMPHRPPLNKYIGRPNRPNHHSHQYDQPNQHQHASASRNLLDRLQPSGEDQASTPAGSSYDRNKYGKQPPRQNNTSYGHRRHNSTERANFSSRDNNHERGEYIFPAIPDSH